MPKTYTEKTWSETAADLDLTFEKWGIAGDEWHVEAGLPKHRAGKPFQSELERTVTLAYTKDGADIVLSITKWPRAVDNFRALYLTVEALRLNEFRGIAEAVRAAYAQLPPAKELATRDPYTVLGVQPNADMELIDAAYRVLAKRMHPDRGGNPAQWLELQQAIEQIRKERG